MARAATKYAGGKGYGSILAFEIKGGLEAGKKFVEAPSCTATSPTSATSAVW